MLAEVANRPGTVQLFVEGGGAVAISSALFYLGRVLGRLDSSVKFLLQNDAAIVQRIERLERTQDARNERGR